MPQRKATMGRFRIVNAIAVLEDLAPIVEEYASTHCNEAAVEIEQLRLQFLLTLRSIYTDLQGGKNGT